MIVLLALLIEWMVGDPASDLHPVAVFGRFAERVERRLYRDTRVAGCMAWTVAVGAASVLIIALLAIASRTGLGWLAGAAVLWATLGWRSLLAHATAVAEASDLSAAREAVGHIVGRDVDAMSEIDVRRAALESLAENASDAVVAPLFWAAIGGPLAAAAYRWINTLDAMWGHRSQRFQHFGWAAARADDLASWVPARLTALFFLVAAHCWPEAGWRSQATAHASPNAGWPETALAQGLKVRLGGPVWRRGQSEDRPWMGPAHGVEPTEASLNAGLRLTHRALLLAAALAAIACR
ncbi:MAG: cobalamin biosynthesis protein CobD [bacterium]|nr:cobalamin biosynthesis protein CobD [bacterium]